VVRFLVCLQVVVPSPLITTVRPSLARPGRTVLGHERNTPKLMTSLSMRN